MSNTVDLDKFTGFEVDIDYESVMKMYADRCLQIVKSHSPKSRNNRPHKYADGWTADIKNIKGSQEIVIWNETNWQLTHLLENGHLIVNKKGGVGWASAQPHIKNSYDQIKDSYIRAMENVKVNIK